MATVKERWCAHSKHLKVIPLVMHKCIIVNKSWTQCYWEQVLALSSPLRYMINSLILWRQKNPGSQPVSPLITLFTVGPGRQAGRHNDNNEKNNCLKMSDKYFIWCVKWKISTCISEKIKFRMPIQRIEVKNTQIE